MKIYKLIGSKQINTIITYSSPSESYLTINYNNGQSSSVKEFILKTIGNLLKSGLIDIKLAMGLYFDYAHLLKGKTLIFPDSSVITPFTCLDNSKELSVNVHEDEQISGDVLQSKEDEDLQKALSVSIQSAPALIDVAQQLNTETVNEHFFEAGITKSQEKTPLQAYSSFSKFSTEFQLINSHKVADFTCEFRNDEKGILLSIVTPDGDKDSLRLSEDNKKEILGCHQLAELAKILRSVMNGEDIAAILDLYVESREDVGFGR